MNIEISKEIISSVATLSAAFVVGIFGTVIQRKYSKERDRQDKESQWRSHALELTKLDLERKLKALEGTKDNASIRPSILDFLANYRDLKELDHLSPKELYLKIEKDRISKSTPK